MGRRRTRVEHTPAEEESAKEVKQNGQQPTTERHRWWDAADAEKSKQKWTTLEHNGIEFAEPYTKINVPILYDGKKVRLNAKCEEIAVFFARKIGSEYENKPTFRKNFFEDFKDALKGTEADDVIEDLALCDFTPIVQYLRKKKQEKDELPTAEKKRLKQIDEERLKKYKTCVVDGRVEKVGNIKVEPPGLFLGRGEHPKMGRVKKRIIPEDVTINIGHDAPIPPCPVPGHKWGKIVHNNAVTWLAHYKDSITGGSKYTWLAASSTFKGMSDREKFEKARNLKNHINRIRRDYMKGCREKSKEIRQRSVAMYLIDKLALRVGNEKGEDEADTVGCCSLRVEHINFHPPSTIELDFLGKDSIRYTNSVEVHRLVYESLKQFCRDKGPSEEVFHRLSVTSLNEHLKSYMDGLSAKVFRTYNASITLDKLLQETSPSNDRNDNVVFYNQQNKEVAILCNHQRALPKQHGTQMEKMNRRLRDTEDFLTQLKKGRRKIVASRGDITHVEVKQKVPAKPQFTDTMTDKEKTLERKRAADAPREIKERRMTESQLTTHIRNTTERVAKIKADMKVKEELKTVALGTSKINYLDPRITVAWCKKHEVPIEKIFAKTLLEKFAWAMETTEEYRF